jgi:hypothetical protein
MLRSPRRLLGIAVLAVAVSALPSLVLGSHSWGGYHWARTTDTFTLKLGDNVSGLWGPMLDTASSDWSESTVLDTTVVPGSANPRNCRATTGMVQVCSARYGNTGWLGVAGIYITGGTHITKAYVKNNDSYFGSSTYQYNNTAEMQHVICQEIGHTFGLDHQSTDGTSLNTCMDYYHNTSSLGDVLKSTSPNQGDYDELLCIYDLATAGQTLSYGGHSCTGTGHHDSFTTVAAVSAAPANARAAESSWGRLVASSDGGRAQTFVLDLGAGNLVVTFVIWARS